VAVFDTEIKNFQTQVTNGSVGVIRGYLANADRVRVRGAEFDGNTKITDRIKVYGSVAYTDGKYVRFTDAPPPLELTGGPQFVDVSGSVLPGISKWATAIGGEYDNPATILGQRGELFGAVDTSCRSSFSSSASYSPYLVVSSYSLVNARAGFRWKGGWALTVWARNLLDKNYFELLTAAPGNTGLFVGQPGDPRTVGVTLRFAFNGR
jgi:iron complex outermembrane receptor protein